MNPHEVYSKEEPAYLEVNNYDNTIRISTPHHDSTIDDWIQMFYTAMVGVTFHPEQVLEAMREFAEERLPEEDDHLEMFEDGDPNN